LVDLRLVDFLPPEPFLSRMSVLINANDDLEKE